MTFTFSEATTDFTGADITAVGGTVTGLSGSGSSYTATLTATDGYSGPGSVTVANASYTDAAGNSGATGFDTVTIDRLSPTVAVNIVDTSLSDVDTNSVVNFTFSEATTDFTLADITAIGGTVSGLSGSGTSYSATFTATDGFSGTGSVTVANASYTDAVGNTGATGFDTVTIDRLNPTVAVNIVDTSLSDVDTNSVVNFTFSEATTDFTLADITAIGGTVSGLSGSGTSYSATFTATDGFSGTGSVTVANASYTDAAGNAGASGLDTVAIDRSNPTVSSIILGDTALTAGETTPLTITFSEAVTGFNNGDVTAANGTLSTLASGDGGVTWTGTFTPTPGVNDATNVVTVASTYTDLVGNAGSTGSSGNYTINTAADTTRPTLNSITAPNVGQTNGATTTVTFVFSEAVTNFLLADITIPVSDAGKISLSNLNTTDSITWTATATRGATNGAYTLTVGVGAFTDLAGNVNSVAITSGSLNPAGVAGEPINLALADPSVDHVGLVTVVITGVPTGWTLNAGIDNGDATWTVQTTNPSLLTVTTSADYAGAIVLGVSMTWTNPDGSTGSVFVNDNIEAYAPGNPIFALSTDDNLTGSSGADMFVFAQPIGNNVIYSFDTAADKIDLIGFTGVTGFANLNIVNDANGNAVVSISDGQTVTLKGVDAATLSAANFLFDVEPVTVNSGTLTISDGAIMPFGGILDNSGTIVLGSSGAETNLEALFRGLTLTGGGDVVLSDSAQNVIFGGSADTVLTNVDNTISGAGQLGAGQLTLVNAGLILADGSHALVIDAGSNAVSNSGVMEATGAGGLVIAGALASSGSLWANGGDIVVHGDTTGAGSATLSGTATLEFGSASDQHVTFDAGAAGTLKLDMASAFSGSVSGFDADDRLDLGDVAFGASTQLTYVANDAGTGGTLSVSDGVHTAQLALNGAFAATGLQANAAGSGSELAYDAPAANYTMQGGLANDLLVGGAGDDLFLGGLGDNTFTGGAGSDTFRFLSGGATAVDTVTDFDSTTNADKLDLRDLLQGEHADATNLDSYLDFSYEAGTHATTVNVMSQGAGVVDHQIQLLNFDVTAFGANDSAIIANLLANGKLTTDV